MTVCNNCDKYFNDNDKYCTQCGCNLEFTDSAESMPIEPKAFYSPKEYGGVECVFNDVGVSVDGVLYEYKDIGRIVLCTDEFFSRGDCGIVEFRSKSGVQQIEYCREDTERFIFEVTCANSNIPNTTLYELLRDAHICELFIDYISAKLRKRGVNPTNFVQLDQNLETTLQHMLNEIHVTQSHLESVYSTLQEYPDVYKNHESISGIIRFAHRHTTDLGTIISKYELWNNLKPHDLVVTVPPLPFVLDAPVVSGTTKTFHIQSADVTISPNMDSHNQVRSAFYTIAKSCFERVVAMCRDEIYNTTSFLDRFDDIFYENLSPILDLSLELLINNGVYDISADDIKREFIIQNHRAMGVYTKVVQICNGIMSENELCPSNANSYFSDIVDAMKITPEQLVAVYSSICMDDLYTYVWYDYLYSYLVIIDILNMHGNSIWKPIESATEFANRILANLNNPSFPENRKGEAIAKVILTNPYTDSLHTLLKSVCNADESKRLIDYFGPCDSFESATIHK